MRVADSSGEAVDNKIRLEVIQQQETLIKEEAAEKQKVVGFYALCGNAVMSCFV